MSLDDLSKLLIVLAAADWVFTAVIYIASRQFPNAALTERATASIIMSVAATFGAILGAQTLGLFHLSRDLVMVLLAGAFILVSAPQFIWAASLVLGKFR